MNAIETVKYESAARRKLEVMQHRANIAPLPACLQGKDWCVLHGDMEEVAGSLGGKVHSIITDPPYTSDTYEVAAHKLGAVASRVLVPGGNLMVWTGQMYLPHIVNILARHGMVWRWVTAYLTPGPTNRAWPARTMSNWIPVVWMTNGNSSRGDPKISHDKPGFANDLAFAPGFESLDVAISGGRCKKFHRWGKSADGADQIVRDYSFEGETVLDPFCGGGGIGEAAVLMGRKFIGIDGDAKAAETTENRLTNLTRR